MPITSDRLTTVFGQTNDTMKYIHKFLKANGLNNIDWNADKFDEKTALSLLFLNKSFKCIQFVQNGGFNSKSERYIEGNTVVIDAGTKYYSSNNAQTSAGEIIYPTTGVLISNEMSTPNSPNNPLMISLMQSPIEKSQTESSVISNLTGDANSSSTLANTTFIESQNKKQSGHYTQGEIVYLKPESVIPSFSDIIISDDLLKVMKAGEINSKGIEMINSVNTLGKQSVQFLDATSKELNEFLNKNENRLVNSNNLNDFNQKHNIKLPTFNENGMFIKNLITDTVIYIPFRPDSVDESYSISWSNQNTRGSAHETYGYEATTGSSPSISFDFDVGALSYYLTRNRDTANNDPNSLLLEEDLIRKSKNASVDNYQASDVSDQIFDIVSNYLNALKALAYPLYTNGLVTPPSCYVSIARTFRFIGVCTAVNISHKGPMYIKPNIDEHGNVTRFQDKSGDQMFMNYSITLNFNKIVNQDFSADTVEICGDNWTGGMAATGDKVSYDY